MPEGPRSRRIQIDGTVKGDFCMGALRIWHWCQSRSKVRFALHSDASTEAATAVAAEYFPITVKITTDWLARWSWHYKNSDAVNACRFTPPSKISVLFNLANTARSSKTRTRNTQEHEQPSDKPNNRPPHQNQGRVTSINPPHGPGTAPAV